MRIAFLLAAWALAGSCLAPAAYSQQTAEATPDPVQEKVLAVGREWLSALDRGQYKETYMAASPLFRQKWDYFDWWYEVSRLRHVLGHKMNRNLPPQIALVEENDPNHAPAGRVTWKMAFQTDFARSKGGSENLYIVQDDDLVWRAWKYEAPPANAN